MIADQNKENPNEDLRFYIIFHGRYDQNNVIIKTLKQIKKSIRAKY